MDIPFWQARWQNEKIGFHLDLVNPILTRHWANIAHSTIQQPVQRVFVPMAGKSLDLCWLADQGHEVVGIEISELAVEAFFAEQSLQATITGRAGCKFYTAGNITLICGDFFALQEADIGIIDLVYDRAAFVAMPPPMRQKYADKLAELCPTASRLLVTLEYDQALMAGPPFAVSEEEVLNCYAKGLKIKTPVKTLATEDVLAEHAHFAAKGVTALRERVYFIQPV